MASAASALANLRTLNRENSVEELNREKDLRFAARLRGALSILERNTITKPFCTDSASLRASMLTAPKHFPMQRVHCLLLRRIKRRSEYGRCKNIEVRVENLLARFTPTPRVDRRSGREIAELSTVM